MARSLDADRAKIHRQDVEGGIGASVKGTDHVTGEGVRPLGVHDLGHHSQSPTPGEWPHQGHRQRFGGHADQVGERADCLGQQFQPSRCPENSDGHQYGNQIGNDFHSNLKTLLGSFHQRFIDLDAASPSEQHQPRDQGRKHPERHDAPYQVHSRGGIHLSKDMHRQTGQQSQVENENYRLAPARWNQFRLGPGCHGYILCLGLIRGRGFSPLVVARLARSRFGQAVA